METDQKLYSQRAIGIATYFGGPLAAGILIRRNYINLNKERQGLNALILGIISTVILFVILFSLPEEIIDKIPNILIPAIYTGIVYLIVESVQGKELKAVKEGKGTFYSAWKATGIGILSGVIMTGGLFGYIFLADGFEVDWDVDTYNAKMVIYASNEAEALELYELLESGTKDQIIEFIANTGIPNWKENVAVLTSMETIENVPQEYLDELKLLKEYSELRVEAYELMSKAVQAESSEYDKEITRRNRRIEEIITEL